MELSKVKFWLRPLVKALPPKRWILISLVVIIVASFLIVPLVKKWMYPLRYEEIILEESAATGADPYLVMAIIRAETKFDPNGQSRVNAKGLMQIMPDTAKDIVKRGNFSLSLINELDDVRINIRMGSWYLVDLSKQFQTDKIAIIAAAYNSGPGTIKKAIESGKWDGDPNNTEGLYGETRHYVQKVTFYYDNYKELYGKQVEEYYRKHPKKEIK
ncbi:lytic transglycosylase domain-containing protein [Risungbinella massiliensis]|uniref:lytic transglycosylase domain-containing protein n=1 Tax=Risungbinella massiliensis TaxID=1329796 RepID=UPI0005CC56A3|nr:lytic transglycosylase domain-containing protein [Risungbinella massiliensis]